MGLNNYPEKKLTFLVSKYIDSKFPEKELDKIILQLLFLYIFSYYVSLISYFYKYKSIKLSISN